ncbi:MAG: hypothetical protein JRJ60_02465, partial [Deltaproteobacteria bacterium]|nr:hypothetical protein [Deltaproteobacteria bacterium]
MVPNDLMGAIDYFIFPSLKHGFGGPFNGQKFRQGMFLELVQEIRPSYVVETGTYRGTTTAAMAKWTARPVFTIELDGRLYRYSWLRLKNCLNVRTYKGDSRKILVRLIEENTLPDGIGLYYLDAHWEEDLPIRKELDLVFTG